MHYNDLRNLHQAKEQEENKVKTRENHLYSFPNYPNKWTST